MVRPPTPPPPPPEVLPLDVKIIPQVLQTPLHADRTATGHAEAVESWS